MPAEPTRPAERVDALHVVVLAPTGRDAALLVEALAAAGLVAEAAGSAPELVARVAEEVGRDGAPRLGAVIATDEALGVDWSVRLAEALDRQPSWSDLPVVLLAGAASGGGGAAERRWAGSPTAVAERLTTRGSVTVLDRPVRVAALVSAARAALRARSRQAEVRDLLAVRDRALADVERASRAKTDFLAMMSHELRTPLNAIAGYVELILMGLRGPVTDAQREDLERVRRSQRHLLGIINDILNFARVESGRVEFDISAVAVADVVAEVTPMIEPQMAAKHLTLDVRPCAADVRVAADREKLRQVLLNLLSNAAKFTPTGGTVAVTVAALDDVDEVHLRVSDTGVGIPTDKVETIFEPFVQVRADLRDVREGTGLGLAISRDLTRGMGGDLRVESAVGVGSTFTVVLRRARAAEADARLPPPSVEAAAR